MVGVGDNAAHATEVVRQRHPQLQHTARIAVAELGVGNSRERVAHGTQPRCPREGGDIGHAAGKIALGCDCRWVLTLPATAL